MKGVILKSNFSDWFCIMNIFRPYYTCPRYIRFDFSKLFSLFLGLFTSL